MSKKGKKAKKSGLSAKSAEKLQKKAAKIEKKAIAEWDATKKMASVPWAIGSFSGYGQAGASRTKKNLKGMTARSESPEHDIDFNNQQLRERARMLYMSSPIATSAVKTQRTNVVGSGLQLKSRVNHEILGISRDEAQAWQKQIEHEFMLWAECKRGCDALGLNDFYGIQQLAFSSWIMSGDVFCLIKYDEPTFHHPYSLRLQLVEADKIATPVSGSVRTVDGTTTGENTETGNLIYDGVEVDENDKVAAYWICSEYPYDYSKGAAVTWDRVEAYGELTDTPNILHLMVAERPDQYRGVTLLAQIIEPLLQTRRYTESELTKAVVQSFFTAFIKTNADPSVNPYNETMDDDGAVPLEDNDYQLGAGTVNVMKPEEDVTFAQATSPSSGFDSFIKALCAQMGAAMEIPSDVLLKQFNSSYSASRAAILEMWKSVKMYREWFIADFCRPVYELFVTEAVARGRIEAPGFFEDPSLRAAWLGSEWVGPSQGQLDPVKEVQAMQLAIEAGFITRADAAIQYNGTDFNATVETLKEENDRLFEANRLISQLTAIEKKGEEGLAKDYAEAEQTTAEPAETPEPQSL